MRIFSDYFMNTFLTVITNLNYQRVWGNEKLKRAISRCTNWNRIWHVWVSVDRVELKILWNFSSPNKFVKYLIPVDDRDKPLWLTLYRIVRFLKITFSSRHWRGKNPHLAKINWTLIFSGIYIRKRFQSCNPRS